MEFIFMRRTQLTHAQVPCIYTGITIQIVRIADISISSVDAIYEFEEYSPRYLNTNSQGRKTKYGILSTCLMVCNPTEQLTPCERQDRIFIPVSCVRHNNYLFPYKRFSPIPCNSIEIQTYHDQTMTVLPLWLDLDP